MQPMHPKTTRAMAAAYGFDASKNAEIRGSWYRLCLQAGLPPADQRPAPGKRISSSSGAAANSCSAAQHPALTQCTHAAVSTS